MDTQMVDFFDVGWLGGIEMGIIAIGYWMCDVQTAEFSDVGVLEGAETDIIGKAYRFRDVQTAGYFVVCWLMGTQMGDFFDVGFFESTEEAIIAETCIMPWGQSDVPLNSYDYWHVFYRLVTFKMDYESVLGLDDCTLFF